MSYPNPFCFR